MNIKVMDLKNKVVGNEDFPVWFPTDKHLGHHLYLMVNYQNAQAQQASASTKGRSDVRGGGAKPFRQKGTGNARRGTNRSPLRVGGGVVFGPKPRTIRKRINGDYARRVVSAAFATKGEDACVVLTPGKGEIKTKQVRAFLDGVLNDASVNRRVMFVAGREDADLIMGCRNIAGAVCAFVHSVSVSDVLAADLVVISEKAAAELKGAFSNEG